MPEEPRPGMPQSEKDRLGAELRAQAEREQRQADLAAGRITATPDDQLDGLDKPSLLAEAEARGVEVRASATKPEILTALRSEAAPADQEGEG
jgi:hypothetical protein